ncbi:MAG: hypothetical protein KKG59_07250, partial [Nanoarchaeota archaeon]|nr:hypothetical protein [Nanoarchaeota archaeon]
SIFFENVLLLEIEPVENCYYKDNNAKRRMQCPISVSVKMLPSEMIGKTGKFRGTGSCTEEFTVSITQKHFEPRG